MPEDGLPILALAIAGSVMPVSDATDSAPRAFSGMNGPGLCSRPIFGHDVALAVHGEANVDSYRYVANPSVPFFERRRDNGTVPQLPFFASSD